MSTEAGKALLAGLAYPYGTRSIPMHIGQPARSRRIVHDAVARALPAIEAEAAALERARLREAVDAMASVLSLTSSHGQAGPYAMGRALLDDFRALLADPDA